MATALEEPSLLKEELTCSVCLDLYREPHMLPCGHNFCLQCLQKLKRRSKHSCLCCPECRENHHSSIQWQKNIKLASIIDGFRGYNCAQLCIQTSSECRSTEVLCDYCGPDTSGDSAKRSIAVKTCLKCEVSMCPEHLQHHIELPAFRSHPLVEPLSDMRKRKCIEHEEMFQYYCIDEHKFLCNACTIEGQHSKHAIKTLKNTVKDLQAPLETHLQKVNRKIRRLEKNLQAQREVEQENKAIVEEVDKQVDTLREVLMACLNVFLSSLSDCVRIYKEDHNLSLQNDLWLTEEDHNHLGVVRACFEQLLQENDPFQFIMEYMSCVKSYRRLLKKPLFPPFSVTMYMDVIEFCMEGKLATFMTDLRRHFRTFINAVHSADEAIGEAEVEENDSDENDAGDSEQEETSEIEEDHSECNISSEDEEEEI